jgi:hypothetical protein
MTRLDAPLVANAARKIGLLRLLISLDSERIIRYNYV